MAQIDKRASKSMVCFENGSNLERIRPTGRGFLAFFHFHRFSIR